MLKSIAFIWICIWIIFAAWTYCYEDSNTDTLMELHTGNAYRFTTKFGRTRDMRVVGYDPIQKRQLVKPIGKATAKTQSLRLADYSKVRTIRPCRQLAKKQPKRTALYMLKTGTQTYKIGCTNDLEQRMRSGRTWCAVMERVATRAIPADKVNNWRAYEQEVMRKFEKKRCNAGGTEVFRMNAREASEATKFLRGFKF